MRNDTRVISLLVLSTRTIAINQSYGKLTGNGVGIFMIDEQNETHI
jgi:hypothetical protein